MERSSARLRSLADDLLLLSRMETATHPRSAQPGRPRAAPHGGRRGRRPAPRAARRRGWSWPPTTRGAGRGRGPRGAVPAAGQPRGQRREVLPPVRRGRGSRCAERGTTSSSCAPTTASASPPRTSTTCSTTSSARPTRRRSPGPAPASAWRSSQRIVTRHGGRIEVASQLGEGTTFTVTLPVG